MALPLMGVVFVFLILFESTFEKSLSLTYKRLHKDFSEGILGATFTCEGKRRGLKYYQTQKPHKI